MDVKPKETKARVIVWGVGRLGSGAVRMIHDKEWIEIVGAIEISKEKIGRDLGEAAGINKKLGIIVSDNAEAVFSQARTKKVNMVLHFTSGPAEETERQIMRAIEEGCDVISTGDIRLIYPWIDYPELGWRVDAAARKNGVTVLQTGKGPGFGWDLTPIFFTGICQSVKKVTLKRLGGQKGQSVAHAKSRGMGLSVKQFKTLVAEGKLHMPEAQVSVHMIAAALKWKLDETRMRVEPITSKQWKEQSADFKIAPGKVCGLKFLVAGIKDNEEVISFESSMVQDPESDGLEQGDTLLIEGTPEVEVIIKGAKSSGGEGNWAHAVNHIPIVMAWQPGLVTVMDLPLATPTP